MLLKLNFRFRVGAPLFNALFVINLCEYHKSFPQALGYIFVTQYGSNFNHCDVGGPKLRSSARYRKITAIALIKVIEGYQFLY